MRTKHCVLSVLGNENDNANADSNNVVFTIKDTELYVPVVTLSARSLYQQKTIKHYQIFLGKDMNVRCIGMNIKQKVRIRIEQTTADILSNQTLWELTDCLF